MAEDSTYFIERPSLWPLLQTLVAEGFDVVGPVVADQAIQYKPISQESDLPKGWHDQQSSGHYQLYHDMSERLFAWANGPQAIRPFLFPSDELLWSSKRMEDGSLVFFPPDLQPTKIAILGVRGCDMAAMKLQDQHFLQASHQDLGYQKRRLSLFLIAVDCSHPADTCFCASTGDGPHAGGEADWNLTELDNGYLVRTGTDEGRRLLGKCTSLLQVPTQAQRDEAICQHQQAIEVQSKALPSGDLSTVLFSHLDSPQWQHVAEQCLACGNCTSVCPTCFCHKETEQVSLDVSVSDHYRSWDSCFSQGHGYMAGHQVRPDIASRYRQWMTHKLGSWHQQYGRSGCVGCGRCTTWCPAGIDFVAVANAVCAEDS